MKVTFTSLLLYALFFASLTYAAAPAWKMVPGQSTLSFTAIQNGAPVTGTFTNFTGEIHFDPEQLADSRVKIIVNVASIADSYNQLSDTLKSSDWFNAKLFPQAVFEAKQFTKKGDKSFNADGILTIRNKSLPVTLTFTEKEYSATKAVMQGSTTIKRTAFGVGQGEWSDTKTVKDDVRVDFTVTGVR